MSDPQIPVPLPEAATRPPTASVPPEAVVAETGPTGGPPPRRTVLLLAAATALLFASTVAFGVLWYLERSQDRTEEAIASVAERFSERLTTFDYRTLDADLAQTRELATGAFERQFTQALGGDVAVFREAITEAEAHSEGNVVSAAVTDIEDQTATAVIVLTQTITNRQTPQPRDQLHILELTLVETSDGWKVDNVDTVGNLAG